MGALARIGKENENAPRDRPYHHLVRPAPIERLDWSVNPSDALRAWPRSAPLAALVSRGASGGEWARWSIFASPSSSRSIDHFAELPAEPTAAPAPDQCPFTTGWIGYCSYEAGRLLEPSARFHASARDDRSWPAMRWRRVEGLLAHDAWTGSWRRIGDPSSIPELNFDAPPAHAPIVGEPLSRTGRAGFLRGAARVLEDIRAGDVYQVNLAHRLTARFAGSTRALLAALLAAKPWFGALIEDPEDPARAIVSMSPELFLAVDGRTGRVVTRPIKGTRPVSGGAPAAGMVADLLESEKDAAELAMIVDLMRNDLGRVARYGTVRVEDPRRLERHESVLHAVATISATLREERTIADLLRASFPPGSITGAPKIRAMQIIDELEPVARGPYCGTIGWLGDDGSARLSVAIRTAGVTGRAAGAGEIVGEIDYPVGAGIVADSTPESEWEETLAKAEAFFRAARAERPTQAGRRA